MSRLDQLIAHNLSLSRKQVLTLFKRRKVTRIDGTRFSDGSLDIPKNQLPFSLKIENHTYTLFARYHVMMHKPTGFVISTRDPNHRTANELLAGQPFADRLVAIGRLDLDTSGLLLWTSEGQLVHRLSHPKRSIPRVYHVGLDRPWTFPPTDFRLHDGHQPNIVELISIERLRCHSSLSISSHTRYFASITLLGGKYHEVRRIFAALGSHVHSLSRVRYGPFSLPPDLIAGQCMAVDLDVMLDQADAP